jgi:hypothetical protein
MLSVICWCGESGIRTRDTLLAYTRFPGVPLQPLEHLSKKGDSFRKRVQITKKKSFTPSFQSQNYRNYRLITISGANYFKKYTFS